jgi:hypothetical protein
MKYKQASRKSVSLKVLLGLVQVGFREKMKSRKNVRRIASINNYGAF